MAQLIWTEPALVDLDEIAEYIALDDPVAASRFVQKIFDRLDRLKTYPKSGKIPSELPDTPYREVIVAPCRTFYRIEKDTVYILHITRSEKLLRPFLLGLREQKE